MIVWNDVYNERPRHAGHYVVIMVHGPNEFNLERVKDILYWQTEYPEGPGFWLTDRDADHSNVLNDRVEYWLDIDSISWPEKLNHD